jgi:hypothetical protein
MIRKKYEGSLEFAKPCSPGEIAYKIGEKQKYWQSNTMEKEVIHSMQNVLGVVRS